MLYLAFMFWVGEIKVDVGCCILFFADGLIVSSYTDVVLELYLLVLRYTVL